MDTHVSPSGPSDAAASSRKSKLPAFEPKLKHPVQEMDIVLQTEAATRLFETTHEPVSSALFMLEDVLPRRAREERAPIDEMLDVVSARLKEVDKSLSGELERLKVLAKNEGAQLPKRYLHVEPVTILGYSPFFFRYVDLVLKLDEVLRWLDGLWFASVVPNKERNDVIVRCRNQVMHASREFQNIKVRAQGFVDRADAERSKGTVQKTRAATIKEAGKDLRKKVGAPKKPKSQAPRVDATVQPTSSVEALPVVEAIVAPIVKTPERSIAVEEVAVVA
jgi:hypothetical protein